MRCPAETPSQEVEHSRTVDERQWIVKVNRSGARVIHRSTGTTRFTASPRVMGDAHELSCCEQQAKIVCDALNGGTDFDAAVAAAVQVAQ